MCKLSRVDLTTVSLGNPRMKIPSLCTWTFVADNTSCQPLWKKHAENHPNTNAESLGNMKPLGFLLSFLWEMSIMHFATKAKNGKFGKRHLPIDNHFGHDSIWAILHHPWLYELQSLRHHSMGREDQKTQAATETTNHSYLCPSSKSLVYKNKKRLKSLVPAANYQKPNSLQAIRNGKRKPWADAVFFISL